MPVNEELLRVLEAREERWNRRLALSRGSGRTLVTATLCLPVAYRTAPEFKVLLRRLSSGNSWPGRGWNFGRRSLWTAPTAPPSSLPSPPLPPR